MINRNYEIARKEKELHELNPFINDFFGFPFLETKKLNHPIMKTDIKENENNYVLTIEVPGFNKEEIELSIDNGYLNISATKNEETKNNNHGYVKQERFCGSYSRSFYVGDFEESQISAQLENGILTVTLPKEANNKPTKKVISIK